jgi:hypothetical protein
LLAVVEDTVIITIHRLPVVSGLMAVVPAVTDRIVIEAARSMG